MARLRVLIAAAGRGTRAGLPYPKTLFVIRGQPILLRICDLLAEYDSMPTIVASPGGQEAIGQALGNAGRSANLVVQHEPRGMGDAVLHFEQSPAARDAEHVLLIWGDIPFIHSDTVRAMVDRHLQADNDFTFVTRNVESAYTIVSRGREGRVTSVVETREAGLTPRFGERDIGLFVFRCKPVFAALREDLPGKFGKSTREHGFLYVISHLVARRLRVEALPIGKEQDLISFNQISDLAAVGD